MGRRSFALIVCVCAAFASTSGRSARNDASAAAHVKSNAIRQLKAMPIAFESNVGQTDRAASFVARGQGYAVWATADGPVLRLRDARASNAGAMVRMRVVGGAATGQPSPESRLPGRANYFI